MDQYCFTGWRLSSVVVVCNAGGGRAGRPPGACGNAAWERCRRAGRSRGLSGGQHCTAGQYGYVPLRLHLVLQVNTLSLTGNFITQISTDAFSKLRHLRSVDLSNNRLTQIAADTFASQHQLRTLHLSGNPIEALPAGCFRGLTELSVLSLAYVTPDEVRVDDEVFDEVAESLTRLELDSSPGLLRALLESDAILMRMRGIGDISARSSDLATVRDDLPLFLAASAVRLSSARWHCDRRLVWLRDWLRDARATASAAVDDIAEENRCASPRRLAGRALFSLADDEFDASTAVPDRPNHRPITTHASSTSVLGLTISRSLDPHRSGSFRTSDEPSGRPLYDNYTMYKDVGVDRKLDDDLRGEPSTRRAVTRDLEDPDASVADRDQAAVDGPTPGTSTDVTTLIAVGVTIGVTIIIVIVILTVIIRLVRGQKHPPSSSCGAADLEVETSGKKTIKQRQRNGTLYYVPASTAAAANGSCLSAPTSRTRLDFAVSSATDADGAKSVGEVTSLLPAASGRDTVTRSTSSGEPLRMYKWEDF